MEKYIYHLSYDIPKKDIITDEESTLERKELIKYMIEENLIELDGSFNIYHYARKFKEVEIAYFVRTSFIFSSFASIEKISEKLAEYNSQLYYVITEVKEGSKPYFACVWEDLTLQSGFEKDLEEIKKELKEEDTLKLL